MTSANSSSSSEGSVEKWSILVAIGLGTFMSALDSSVVNAILPVMRVSLNSDVAAIEWVVIAYLLTVSGLLLAFGRLGDLRGHKPVYSLGFIIFVISSALCGLAPNAGILVAFRALQAIGAAMLYANAPAILTKTFPPQQRGQALGLQATMTYLGLTTGPSLGGWLADIFSWRAVFFINVPVGLLALFLVLRFIPSDRPKGNVEPFDITGALIFSAGLVSLLLGLNQGANWGWTSPLLLVVLATALILLGIFVRVEIRNPFPMLDLGLFTRRIFTASVSSAVLNYICLYSVLFLMPFYLIQGRGLTSSQAGLLLTAQPIVMAIAAPIFGSLSDRIGSRLPAVLGMLVLAVGLFLLSRLEPASHWGSVSLALAVAGLGTGMFVSPNNSALMGSAPANRQGIASGMLAIGRNVGMALGIGMAGAILSTFSLPDSASSLFAAIRIGFMVASGVAVLAALVSAVRGNDHQNG
ncbi:MAG TPA: MFS transporter [Anaerolineaceae bacterium]|nr:MFS transporter [Anaerolineaceae bacterium]